MIDIHTLAKTGHSVEDGMGSTRHLSLFDDLLFLPATLSPPPLLSSEEVSLRTTLGPAAKSPLTLSSPILFSAMSFGAVSREVKIALATASAKLDTATNSGEGGMLDEERSQASHYILQLASGRFGQTPDRLTQADAIEIKLSQSAKPGQGGYLPASKVTEEIASVRNLPPNSPAYSPARHPDISSPQDLTQKVQELRKLTGGKPIGIKFTAGHIERDLTAILPSQPDYLVLDGFGGGTGSAPKFVKDHTSLPHPAFLVRVKKYLTANPPSRPLSLIVTGGFRTSADITKALALGADAVYLASAALMALGCEQYRLCHKGSCPTSIATQDPSLRSAFNPSERSTKLTNFIQTLSEEIRTYCRICGKNNVHALSSSDLSALTLTASRLSGVPFCADPE